MALRLKVSRDRRIQEVAEMTIADIAALLRDIRNDIDPELRELLADRIEGKIKGKTGPKSNSDPEFQADKVEAHLCFSWLTKIEKLPKETAKSLIAEWFGVSSRSITNWLSDFSGVSVHQLSLLNIVGTFEDPEKVFGLDILEHHKPEMVRQWQKDRKDLRR